MLLLHYLLRLSTLDLPRILFLLTCCFLTVKHCILLYSTYSVNVYWMNERMNEWWHKTVEHIYCLPWNYSGSYRCFRNKWNTYRRILLLVIKYSFSIHFMFMSCKFVEAINTVNNLGPTSNILKKKMYIKTNKNFVSLLC